MTPCKFLIRRLRVRVSEKMKKTIIIIAVIACCVGCSSSRMAAVTELESRRKTTPQLEPDAEEPTTAAGYLMPQKVEPQYVDIAIDCGTDKLGAYHIDITYNPAVVAISEILSPGESTFSGMPMVKRQAFRTGWTRVIGLHPGQDAPSGRVPIARVRFEPRGVGKSHLNVTVRSLYNPDSKPVSGSAVLSAKQLSVTR